MAKLKNKHFLGILALILFVSSISVYKLLISNKNISYELDDSKTNEYGAFVVGEDIKPGTYKLEFTNKGALHISKNVVDVDTLDSGVLLESIESSAKETSKRVTLEEHSILTLDANTEVKLTKVNK